MGSDLTEAEFRELTTPEPPKTICGDCRHFLNREPTGPRSDVWYNHMCSASPRPDAIDPVTGKHGYAGKNDLGGAFVTDERYMFCRDVNTGNCSLFDKV